MVNAMCVRHGVNYQIRTNIILELIAYSLLYFSLPNTGSVANYKLTTVAECLGISTDEAHTALADVRMTAACLRKYFQEFTKA
jgi:DNA polymerase III epsilon subunit-like protein